MSRIGKKIIELPEKTEIAVTGNVVSVKGPKGNLERNLAPDIELVIEGNTVTIKRTSETGNYSAWGTSAAHILNMIKGVNEPYTKKLILEGIGFKADVKGTDLVLALGFSHPIKIPIPESLKIVSDKGIVAITGINKDEVGQFAANLRALKKPEPYKGKGFRYEGEVIRRKQGKKSV